MVRALVLGLVAGVLCGTAFRNSAVGPASIRLSVPTCTPKTCTGNVSLTSDAEVVAWNALGCSAVVGTFALSGTVTDVNLPCLASVTSTFTATSAASLTKLSAPSLIIIGGIVTLETNAKLLSLDFPVLTAVNARMTMISNTVLTSINLPVLASTNGYLIAALNPALTKFDLPSLVTTGVSYVAAYSNAVMTSFTVPRLASTTAIYAYSNPALTAFASTVSSLTILSIYSNATMTDLSLPSLTTVSGVVTLTGNAIANLSLPALVTVGTNFYFYSNANVTGLSLPSLTTVSGILQIHSNASLKQCIADGVKNQITTGPSSYGSYGNNGTPNICASKGLEFAPGGGVGMGLVCACNEVTGSLGERGSFARASAASCSKSNSFTTYAVSDVVSCTTDKPLAEYAVDSGVLGALWESAATEQLLRTNEFTNAAWEAYSPETADPTLYTTDGGAAYDSPLGLQTAFRVNVPACSGEHGASYFGQSFTATASVVHSCSLWVKGETGTDLGLINYADSVEAGTETVCAVTSGAWTRCEHNWTQAGNTTGNFGFGCQADDGYTGQSELPVGTFFVAGANCTPEPRMSSYVAATTAAVTRAASQPWYLNGLVSGTSVNVAATVTPEYLKTGAVFTRLGMSAADNLKMTVESSKATCTLIGVDAGVTTVASAADMTIRVPNRVVCKVDGTTLTTCLGGICVGADAGTLSGTARDFYVGSQDADGNEANAIISRVCVAVDGGCAL